MKTSWLSGRGVAIVAAAGSLMLSWGCELPANFWADKGAEVLNRSIFAVINAVLNVVTGGTVVL